MGKKDSISLIRLVSCLMIFSCHVMQYLGMELAWWFNVGVQIFLFLSGYLYGQKSVGEISGYYKRRFKKILVPFILVAFTEIILFFIFAKKLITPETAIRALFLNTTLAGGGHLWFVPTILLCIVITPILESFYSKVVDVRKFLFTTFLFVQIVSWFCIGFASFFNPAWISCYVIGYSVGINEKKGFISGYALLFFFGLLAIQNIFQIMLDYTHILDNSPLVNIKLPKKNYRIWKNFNHVWLGTFLFLLMKILFDLLPFNNIAKVLLRISDEYSYVFYLVHHFLIIGPFSLMKYTGNLFFNLILIFIGVCFLTFIYKIIESCVYLLMDKYLNFF